MADPGFLSGFIGKGIDIAISQILYHAGIALSCKTELNDLRVLVRRIEPIATSIRQYRLELNRNRGTSTSTSDNNASQWVKKLHGLLQQALPLVQKCTIPSFNVFARYQMSRVIGSLISEIKEHLEVVPLILLEQQTEIYLEMRRESAQASTSGSASTSQAPTGTFYIEEALVVGQDQAFATLENFLIDAEVKTVFRTGVVGKGGSGKSLLLKRLFNSQKVRDLFRDDLLLWLTVSLSPSFSSLRNDLCKQIAVQTKAAYDQNMNEEDVKRWLSERLQENRFALFLDDVWGEGGKLQEQLGLSSLSQHSNHKIIVSSRNHRALREMGVAETSALTMGDLSEEESWKLFAHHAFPYHHGILPANMDERRAKAVCDKCGGLPLAIKVIGRTMAGISDPQEWELAVLRLPNANIQDHQALNDCLRWSYDALGNTDVNLQLCFLCLAAFREDEIITVDDKLIPLWLGEGLLERNGSGHDPYEMGRIYTNILADRCLIEPLLTDVYGRVVHFRMHDILRGFAIQIGEQEEKFYCRAGNGLTDQLVENEYSECTRLYLNDNKLSSLPSSFTTPEIFSLLIAHNSFTKIPRKAIGNMRSLKVLDLSGNPMESLPKSLGSLKQLVSLHLRWMPIKRLPAALTNLASLQVLDLTGSKITKLPFGIHKLTSLRRLDLFACDDLQCLPRSISRLTSLQCLNTWRWGCEKVWTKHGKKKAASVNDLASLRQLKRLGLWNMAGTMSEGTLGSMLQMETLALEDYVMMSLPGDMMKLSKLKILWLSCPDSTKSLGRTLQGLFSRSDGQPLTLRDTLKPILIPCYDLCSASPFLFAEASAKHTQNFNFNMWEVCHATMCSPGFEKPITMKSLNGQTTIVGIDGGLVTNNPTAAAITHVMNNKVDFPSVKGMADILVLSLGGGEVDCPYKYEQVKSWGILEWAKPIMNIVSAGVSDIVDHAVSVLFRHNPQNYVRLQVTMKASGGVSERVLMELAEATLKEKSTESMDIPFGWRRRVPQSNAERLDWFAEQLAMEHLSRAATKMIS